MFIYQRLILTKHAKLSGKTWKNISKPTFKSQEIHPEMSVLRYLLSGGLIDLPKKSRAFDCICHDSWGNSTSFVSFVSTWVSKKKGFILRIFETHSSHSDEDQLAMLACPGAMCLGIMGHGIMGIPENG